MILFESTSVERLRVAVQTSADPTATPPEFSVTNGPRVDPGAWVQGRWDSDFNGRTGKLLASTPPIGPDGAGDLVVSAGAGDYDLWIRWAVGDEVPVLLADQLRIR